MIKFYTQWDRPPERELERLSRKDITERVGYVSAEKQIQNLLNAGFALRAYNQSRYDTSDINEDLPIDPTRKPGFDLADADAYMRGLHASRVKKDTLEAEKKASEKPLYTPDPSKKEPPPGGADK